METELRQRQVVILKGFGFDLDLWRRSITLLCIRQELEFNQIEVGNVKIENLKMQVAGTRDKERKSFRIDVRAGG